MAILHTLGIIHEGRGIMGERTKVVVLGSGGWGTAVALLFAQRLECLVSLWVPREDSFREILRKRENHRYLPGIHIPEFVSIEHDCLDCLREADWWVVATPAAYLDATLTRIMERGWERIPRILSLVKGMDPVTSERPSQLLNRWAGHDQIVVLSGPSHAEEVARGMPASVVAASRHPALAGEIQDKLGNPRFRIYTSEDVVGVECAGVHKNVIGIAAGICAGLGLGDNAVSALLTRGLAEMARWGSFQGGQPDTFMGLAGMGDLITTCFSPHGRNRQVGFKLAAGRSLEQIQGEMQKVAEGVNSARVIHKRATEACISLPITEAVYRVLFEGIKPQIAVEQLLQRAPRPEAETTYTRNYP